MPKNKKFNQFTWLCKSSIETGRSTLQIDGNSAGRYALHQNLFERRDTVGERHHQNPNDPQPATITQGVFPRAHLSEITCAIVGFTAINAFFTASNMLGAFMFKEDVYEFGLAAAVGSITLTTIGALFHVWAHCAGSRLEEIQTASLHGIGNFIATFGSAFISGLIGQLILHGGSTADLNGRLVFSSLFGSIVAVVALWLLSGIGLCLDGCCNPPSSGNSTISNHSVGIDSIPRPTHVNSHPSENEGAPGVYIMSI